MYDSEIAIDGYNIARNDRNRKGGGVACYIRNNICFNLKTCLSRNIENIFINRLFPNTKPITIGVEYKPPNQTRFLEQIIAEFTFHSIESSSVLKLLKNVEVNKAAGMDNISGRFLKDGADILAIPVTQICNLSNNYKLAKLKPLYKKGSKTDPKNFRLKNYRENNTRSNYGIFNR